MLQPGKAFKVSIYLTDGTTHNGEPTATAIIAFLFENRVSGATALKGFAGFGSDHHLHTNASMFLADKLPLKVEFIETEEKINSILPQLKELTGTGMIEMQETIIVKAAGLTQSNPS